MAGDNALRTLLGLALIGAGLVILAGYAPAFATPHTTRVAGWLAIAAGVWLTPFLHRSKD